MSLMPPPQQASASTLLLLSSTNSISVCSKRVKLSVDLITVEKWIEEACRCLTVRQMSQTEHMLFLYDYLDGGATAELDFHGPEDRGRTEKIFSVNGENYYYCSQCHVNAQLQFLQGSHREWESLTDYSHV